MATYTKAKLSASDGGKGILITGTTTASGVVLHTADAAALDEIHLWLVNTGAAAVKTTIEWGETTAPNGNIEFTVPGEDGLYAVIPGLLLTSGYLVKAFAATGNVVVAHGYVNRIS